MKLRTLRVLLAVLTVPVTLLVTAESARAYPVYRVRSDSGITGVNVRTSAAPDGNSLWWLVGGESVQIACQTGGISVAGIPRSSGGTFDDSVWDVLPWDQPGGGVWMPELGIYGAYVNDGYLNTPVVDGFSPGIARCPGSYSVVGVTPLGGANLSALSPGQTFEVQAAIKRAGAIDMVICGSPGELRLGTENPRDHSSPYLPSGGWERGPNRPDRFSGAGLGCETLFGPSGSADPTWDVFSAYFAMRAPTTGGDYSETFGVVAEGQTWLSGPPIVVSFHVNGSPPPPPPGHLSADGPTAASFSAGDIAPAGIVFTGAVRNDGGQPVFVQNLLVGVADPTGQLSNLVCTSPTGQSVSNITIGPSQSVSCRVDSYAAAVPGHYLYWLDWQSGDNATHRGQVTGDLAFDVRGPARPFYDNLAYAGVLHLGEGESGTNVGATREAGEPLVLPAAGGRTVWWRFTAPQAGNFTFDTNGSTMDTVLGVFTGPDVASLLAVATNDDAPGRSTSAVTIHAGAGSSYAIAVDGHGPATGQISIVPSFVPDGASILTAVTPRRVLDTRPAYRVGYNGAKPTNGALIDVPLAGLHGIPVNATAVVATIAATEAVQPGFVQALPKGTGQVGVTSSLNIDEAGQTIAGSVIVPLGAGGAVQLYTQRATHLVLDVSGYFTPVTTSVAAGRIRTMTPVRLFDSRSSSRRAAGSTTAVVVAGAHGIPVGATAAIVNLAVTNTRDPGFVQAAAATQLNPGATSSLNVTRAGQTIANMAVVPLSPDGRIAVYTSIETDLIVDIVGWSTSGADPPFNDGFLVPVSPARLFDTRQTGGAVAAGGTLTVGVAGNAGVPAQGFRGVVGNLAVTSASGAGFVQAGRQGAMVPGSASTLNVDRRGQTIANSAAVEVDASHGLAIYTQAGGHLIFDVMAWLT